MCTCIKLLAFLIQALGLDITAPEACTLATQTWAQMEMLKH